MQTPAEKYLIKKLADTVALFPEKPALLLNIGANTSTIIEDQVIASGQKNFIADRVDIVPCESTHAHAGKAFIGSVEHMKDVQRSHYDAAFANYLLEHVADLKSSAKEIARVLKPGGYFITSIPNPASPEFLVSRFTPLWFHQLIKGKGEGKEAHATHYTFKTIPHLHKIFSEEFTVEETVYYSFTEGYLYRFPGLHVLSRIYDRIINTLHITWLMGNVCVVFKKK